MATPVVPSTNIGIYSSLRLATDCNQTTNLSLASLLNGGAFNSIDNSFGAAGGAMKDCDLIGGSNNPLQSTAGSVNLYDDDIGTAPFHMSHTIGGQYT